MHVHHCSDEKKFCSNRHHLKKMFGDVPALICFNVLLLLFMVYHKLVDYILKTSFYFAPGCYSLFISLLLIDFFTYSFLSSNCILILFTDLI